MISKIFRSRLFDKSEELIYFALEAEFLLFYSTMSRNSEALGRLTESIVTPVLDFVEGDP